MLIMIMFFIRADICINGDKWFFKPEKEENFVPIRVPSTWKNSEFDFNIENRFCGENNKINNGNWTIKYKEGVYKLFFHTPEIFFLARNKRILLEVNRVNHLSEFYLNGIEIGKHCTSFVPFRKDITELLRNNMANELVIKVKDGHHSNFDLKETMPVLHYYIHKLGGIEGDVMLRIVPDIYVERVLIDTKLRENKIRVRYKIRNCGDKKKNVKIITSVRDDNGKDVILFENLIIDIPPDTSIYGDIEQKINNKVILWGYEPYGKPYLYSLNMKIVVDDEILDDFEEKFGFREFYKIKNKFYLNGKEIFLYGDNVGAEITYLGCLHRNWIVNFLKAEREANINFIRIHTFIPPLSWIEEFDKNGMLLEMEFIVSKDDSFTLWQEGVIPLVLEEYYNHPSIIIWSLDNESASQNKKLNKNLIIKHKRGYEIIRKIDPYRLVDHQGDIGLGLSKNFGVDFYPEIFNMHPYGNPITNEIKDFKIRFNYVDTIPLMIGEICDPNMYNWINNINELIKTPQKTYKLYYSLGRYFSESVKSSISEGASGVAFISLLFTAYWGSISNTKMVYTPFDFKDSKDTLFRVYWPSYSGFEPKVDYIYLWNWHSSQINWFDSSRPIYTLNIVHKTIRETYKKIFSKELPKIIYSKGRNIIIESNGEYNYVYLKNSDNPDYIIGVVPDKKNKSWFFIDKKGKYEIFIYDKKSMKKKGILKIKNDATKLKSGYDYILKKIKMEESNE